MQARNLHCQCRTAHVACAPSLSRNGKHRSVSVRRAAAGEPGVRTAADSTDHLLTAQPSAVDSSSSLSTLESSVDEALQSSSREEALSQLGIAPIDVQQLFDAAHVTDWDPLLLAYAPFGCLLALLRMAAWIGGIALDASWFRNPAVVDAYMALLGVTVVWHGEENIPAERHVLVSNHISTADLLVLFQRPQRYVHLITTALPAKVYACQHLPAILQPADKRTYLSIAEQTAQQQQQQQQQQSGLRLQVNSSSTISSSSGEAGPSLHSLHAAPVEHSQHQQQLHSSMQEQHSHTVGGSSITSSSSRQSGQASQLPPQQDPQQPSVHLFPEGGMTNGKGMMRFSRGFMLFADKLPVVPVSLRIRGAFPQIRTHTIDSNFLVNLFWCSFQPWTVMEARALPPMRLAPGESKAAFVQRVQLSIAEDLRVWVADLSIQQKRQLAGGRPSKQQQQQQQRRASARR